MACPSNALGTAVLCRSVRRIRI